MKFLIKILLENEKDKNFKKLRFCWLFIAILTSIPFSFSSNVNFYSINSMYGVSMRETVTVIKDDNGFVWTSSKTGIMRLTEHDYRIYELPYVTADIISVHLIYRDKQLLSYTNNGQIFSYNEIYDRFDLLTDLRSITNDSFIVVHSMQIDVHGNLWISTSIGLYKYQKGELLLINNESTDIDNNVWYDDQHLVYATSHGLWMINIETLVVRKLCKTTEYLLQVTEFYNDKQKQRLWVGTNSSGLFYYDFINNTFSPTSIKSFPRQPILAIASNSDSTLLIGVDGQGILEINRDGTKILNTYNEDVDNPTSLRGDGVYDIFCDENNRIWVCTYSGGVSYFDQNSPLVNKIVHQINNPNSLTNNNVNKVLEDSQGNMWFATNNGVCCWDVKTDRWKVYFHDKHE